VAVPPMPGQERNYLSGFLNALMAGTVDRAGNDPTGLSWRRTTRGVVCEIIRDVTAFTDYCAAEDDVAALNPPSTPTFQQAVAAHRRMDKRFRHSLLSHLGNAKMKAREIAHENREVTGPSMPVVARTTPAYPAERFAELLGIGFRRRSKGELGEQYNIRDMVIAL